MDLLKTLSDYWPICVAGLTVLAGFSVWQLNTHFAPRKGFDDHEERITNLEGGHITLKGQVDNLPSVAAMHRLEIQITEIVGQYKTIGAQLTGQDAALKRLNNTLDRITESSWGKK